MGKNLKGKQLGKGLGQRKDKYYYAKYSYCLLYTSDAADD